MTPRNKILLTLAIVLSLLVYQLHQEKVIQWGWSDFKLEARE